MMKRNIATTIEFSNGSLSINVLEKLSNNTIEIFYAKGQITKAHDFMKESLSKIEKLLGGSIKEVAIVINPSEKVDGKIELVKETIKIAGREVSQKDIDNLIELTKQKHKKQDREIILVQPLQFEVVGEIKKAYSKAPIGKHGETLLTTFALTDVKSSVMNFIQSIIKAHSLDIAQVLLKPQTISQNNLSQNALASGAVLVHVGESQSFVTINKNKGTVASISFYDSGFKNLVNGVAKVFGCNQKEARDLIMIYGSLNEEKENRVIYIKQEGINERRFTNIDLKNIITAFVRRMLVLSNKFIEQKGVQNLPVVLSGQITKINAFETFALEIFQTNTSVYKPMSFVETTSTNHNGLGFMNWTRAMDEVLGQQFNTIVETNPNAFSSLKKQGKIWTRLIEKIGGKYDWHN